MARLAVVAAAALLAGCGGDDEEALPQGGDRVEIDPSRFSAEIDNPYWPMAPGTVWIYRAGEQRVEVRVTNRTRSVMGVETRVVHDVVTENGVPVEDTFEDGKPAGHAGAWEAGVDGALPGVVVPAEPEVGMSYRQEYDAGEAEDRATVLSVDATASVPYGEFTEALQTEDTTPLEPGIVEHKFYARDVGPVLAVKVKGETGREELVSRTPD